MTLTSTLPASTRSTSVGPGSRGSPRSARRGHPAVRGERPATTALLAVQAFVSRSVPPRTPEPPHGLLSRNSSRRDSDLHRTRAGAARCGSPNSSASSRPRRNRRVHLGTGIGHPPQPPSCRSRHSSMRLFGICPAASSSLQPPGYGRRVIVLEIPLLGVTAARRPRQQQRRHGGLPGERGRSRPLQLSNADAALSYGAAFA